MDTNGRTFMHGGFLGKSAGNGGNKPWDSEAERHKAPLEPGQDDLAQINNRKKLNSQRDPQIMKRWMI